MIQEQNKSCQKLVLFCTLSVSNGILQWGGGKNFKPTATVRGLFFKAMRYLRGVVVDNLLSATTTTTLYLAHYEKTEINT